ncbi:MAG: serine/threonine protein kinase [Polyangiaceae bacterium]
MSPPKSPSGTSFMGSEGSEEPTLSPSQPRGAAPSSGSVEVKELPPPSSKADAQIGKTIDGRYVVERILGEGGMGIVYAGRHKMIDKRVAIKVLRGEMASDHELNDRFLQEARAASAIGNPHIIDISDFGQLPDGSTYFVMEFLDGRSLSGVLTDCAGPMPVARICHIGKQIAQGLSSAHAANIVHRDLKPDNVMLINRGHEKDFVKVLDFGIAKVGGSSNKVTKAGSVFGTPHYMSPEQAAGATVDHRTDIYALGVILYEAASGKVPFDAENFMGILTQHMYKAPVPIRAIVPEVDVPPGLDAIVLKCLTKKPEGRYQTMDELVADLAKLEQGMLPDAVHEMMARSGGFNVPADYFRNAMPEPVPGSPPERAKRWPLYAAIAAVATVIGVVAVSLVARPPNSTAGTLPVPSAAPSAAAPAVTATAAPVPTAILAPVAHEVLVTVAPGDATILRDGKNLGPQPVVLHMADGETASLSISRKGYKPKNVVIDGRDSRVAFSLDSAAAASPAGPAKPAGGGPKFGGIDDVGDPFAKH